MNKKRIEQSLKNGIEQTTPDVLGNILALCGSQNGKVMKMTKSNNKKFIRGIVGLAAAFAIIIGALFIFKNNNGNSVHSTITFDVNPSVQILVTDKEKVVEVKALNKDAEVVLGDLDFKDSSLDVAVNAIIGSMVQNGYIDELSNSILISVDSKSDQDGKALEKKLNQNVEKLLNSSKLDGAVLSQTVKHSDDLDDKAEKYGITIGKAQLIKDIISADNRYTFEQLVPLTINELNLISKSGEKISDKVNVTGTASDKKYIGIDKAKEIALNHIGIKEGEYTNYSWEIDYENGKMIYEIDFNSGEFEYEFDIDAVNGDVINLQKEYDVDDDKPNFTEIPEVNNYIGETAARDAALNHAGVKAADCRELEVELDRDDGYIAYSVEFKCGGFEYEYEIDPLSGNILLSSKDIDD